MRLDTVKAMKKKALTETFKTVINIEKTLNGSDLYFTGKTKTKFDNFVDQLKADLFDEDIVRSDIWRA